jgi:sulfhydrogenase subunit beta (sulfur reductase)
MVSPRPTAAGEVVPTSMPGGPEDAPRFLPRADLDRLLDLLRADGRKVLGPTVVDGAIAYDEITSSADLPAGWTDRQEPGRYRLEPTGQDRLFDYAVGPTAWKRFTFPPRVPLTKGRRVEGRVKFYAVEPDPPRLAFLGVRACEIAALLTQDRVLTGGPITDEDYAARRAASVVIAVECVAPASTCFCTSMGTGPEVTSGFDLALTELDEGFVVRVGSDTGRFLIHRLGLAPAAAAQLEQSRAAVADARARIGDPVPTDGLPARLMAAADSPRWAEIAERCLSCTNCTLVCPTCFCTSVTQTSDLTGSEAVAGRAWDSCFTLGFSRVAGGNFRPRVQDRYRQWLTHKFAGWWEQFGSSGCVGCGRCITWCPVGIDVRAELMAVAPPDTTAVGMPDPLTLPVVAPLPMAVEAAPVVPVAPVPLPEIISTVVEVHDAWQETLDVTTLRFLTDDPSLLAGRPGQFVMAALPGFAAAPISVSRYHDDGFELTIRAAGAATRALCALRRGDSVGIRGPMGRPWPVEEAYGRDVVIVTGGIGLAPLRPLLDAILRERDRFGAVRLLYGARSPGDRLYVDELSELGGRDDLEIGSTVDRAGPEWFGRVGVVTTLFEHPAWDGTRTTAFVCGPERMMEATADVLGDLGVTTDRIWMTMERHMDCGVGLCGHCQLGPKFVCKDGPVFSLAELGSAFAREGW